MGKCGEVGLLFRGFPILPHTRFTHRGIHVGNPLRCLCGISPSIYHIVFVPTRCVACVHVFGVLLDFPRAPLPRQPSPAWLACAGRSYSHCTGGGAGPRRTMECFVKEKTKTRAPAHLRNHSKSVGIARTLLIWQGRHVRPRYASVVCWFRGE